MMIDSTLLFASKQAVTSAAVAGSNGVVDLGLAGRNIGVGEQLCVVVLVTTAMTSAYTMTPTLRTSATITGSALPTTGGALSGSPTTIATIGTFAAASAAGTMLVMYLPPSSSYLQYIDVYFTPSGTLTGGNFSAFICKDTDLQTFYSIGYTVS